MGRNAVTRSIGMEGIAVRFEKVSKQYRLGSIGTGTLSHDLNRWWAEMRGREDPYLKIGQESRRSKRADGEYIWALRNIDFEIRQGQAIGIIGRNGAGKSTLLKILSRITLPTSGRIMASGRIASLLEVGTGFHPEMTGRENVYMNGTIMGMTRREIRARFDEIVEFSGVGQFIDTPVKRYSSGMTVRLGFAVAAHLEPEILVVDEVLAVGDADFQNRCLGKMEDISRSQGRTILFVSHNMAAVERLCKQTVVIENGMLGFQGDTSAGIAHYLSRSRPEGSLITDGILRLNTNISIQEITLNGTAGNLVHLGENEHTLDVSIHGFLQGPIKMALEVRLYDKRESLLALYSPGHLKGRLHHFKGGPFVLQESIRLPDNMTSGTFFLDIDLTQPNVEVYMHIPKYVKLTVKGIAGSTGLEFNYDNCGLLMLK